MTTIAATLNSQQIAAAKSAAGAITESAKAVVSDKRFVFLAAFDGTNNDRNAIYKSGSPLDTNVAQLEYQVQECRCAVVDLVRKVALIDNRGPQRC